MVVVGLSTIVERKENLPQIISVIAKQADLVFISLVNHSSTPKFLSKYSNIEVFHVKNKGAEYKFYGYNLVPDCSYFLTIDDDILYPCDYVDVMKSKMKFYGPGIAVCVHGSNIDMKKRKHIHSMVGKRGRKSYHYGDFLPEDKQVLIPGTGTLCLRKSEFKMSMDDFKVKNMDDSYLGCFLYQQGIKVYSVTRPENWLVSMSGHSKRIHQNNPFDEIDQLYHSVFKGK